MKRIAMTLTLLLGVMFATAAVAQDDMGAMPATVVDVAVGNEDFSMLVEALQTAGLVEMLQGEGPFTVFAPTNEAFQNLMEEMNVTFDEWLERDDLADILAYHVVSGAMTSADILEEIQSMGVSEDDDMFTLETLAGSEMGIDEDSEIEVEVRLVDQIYLDGSAHLTTVDIEAGNGYVHVIDEVLMPGDDDTEQSD